MTSRIRNPDTLADIQLREHLSSPARQSFIMLAGAGSGKTTSLIKALDHIGHAQGEALKAQGQQIACITYTEVAVGEIMSDIASNPLFHVSTIHSFLWELAKPFQANISAWVVQHMSIKLEELRQERDNFGPRVQQRTRDRNMRAIERLELQIPEMGSVRHFTYGTGSNYREGILGHDDIIKMVPALIVAYPLLTAVIMQKYPFFFVDESQDTFPNVVEALRVVAQSHPGKFTLGFFGDQMQKIYVSGAGEIKADDDWKQITKPENFRCPTKVLAVINKIRASADGLQQTRGRHETVNGTERPAIGTARLFVLPTDSNRSQNLNEVRQWLVANDDDPDWLDDTARSDVRILVIEHRMAARRLGFAELHSAFSDDSLSSLSDAFREGTAWPLRPFRDVLIPLFNAIRDDNSFEVISTLRKYSPALDPGMIKAAQEPRQTLAKLKDATTQLVQLMAQESSATVLDALRFAKENHLLLLDERLHEYVTTPPNEEEEAQEQGQDDDQGIGWRLREADVIRRFFACPAKQVVGYDVYRNEISRYSTHQGVKGAEFARVIVIIDDDESKHFQFSYEKLLGLKELSRNDIENQSQGKETVFERTRRLLYVCCSRATRDLVVVLHTQDTVHATQLLRGANLFESEDIHELSELQPRP